MEQKPVYPGENFVPLLKFMFPVLLAQLPQSMYGAVDLLVVGQFADASGVAAVSTGRTIMQTVTLIISGLTMGARQSSLAAKSASRPTTKSVGSSAPLQPCYSSGPGLNRCVVAKADQFIISVDESPQQAVSQCVWICH